MGVKIKTAGESKLNNSRGINVADTKKEKSAKSRHDCFRLASYWLTKQQKFPGVRDSVKNVKKMYEAEANWKKKPLFCWGSGMDIF